MNPFPDPRIIQRYETTTESNNVTANIIPDLKTNSVITLNLDNGVKIGMMIALAALTIYLLSKTFSRKK